MIELFLEEKNKIRYLSQMSFRAIGPDEEGYVPTRFITQAIEATLRQMRMELPESIDIGKLVDQESKLNPGKISGAQFEVVIRLVFISTFYQHFPDYQGFIYD